MTNDEQAFLAAIVATPEDDTPRLVFADWLDERGVGDDAARAALIRAQCALEQLSPGSKQRRVLERETRALLKSHAKRWTASLREARVGENWTFRRGFVDSVSIAPKEFVQHAEVIFRHAPTLRTVRFPYAQSEVTALARCPFLARLASVDLTQMCTCGQCPIDVELRNLFKSKHTRNLTSLNISLDRIDARMARELIASEWVARLAALDLSGNPLGAEGVTVLASATRFTRMTELNLARTGLGADGVAALASATHFPSLARLNLRQNNIRAGAARTLVSLPFFGRLTALDLSGNRIGEGGSATLAKLTATAKLQSLDVSGNHLSEKARAALKTRFGTGVKFD